MNKRKKVDMSKLCLKSKPTGVPNQISQFFTSNEPSTSSSTEFSRPLVDSANIHPIQHAVPTIVNTLKAYEHTKDKINRLTKRKNDLSPSPIVDFFDPTNNVSMAEFESPKRIKPAVKKSIVQPKTKRATKSNRSKQNSLKNMLQNKTEETLFSELLAQQCVTENVHPDELQMALALSKSLVETFSQKSSSNDSTIEKRPAETRFSDIQKTLENFGFKSAGQYSSTSDMKRILRVNKNYKGRRKFSNLNLNYLRKSFEEKLSRIVTENVVHDEFEEFNEYSVFSKMLHEMRIRSDDTFFRLQSSDLHSSKLLDRYYTGNLFEISTVRSDFLLKNWNNIPGRTPSPARHQHFNMTKITELSEEFSQDCQKFPEFNSDAEIMEMHNEKLDDIPILSRTCIRHVESPDLFSDSEAEFDEANKSSPNLHKPYKIIGRSTKLTDESETDNLDIAHFETYTSEEAKIKDVVASKLSQSNANIFADLSVDMIDLTSECGSCDDDNAMSPSILSKPNQYQSSIERNVKLIFQEESILTLSSETSMSESSRNEAIKVSDSQVISTLTEPDSILTNNIALDLDTSNHIESRDFNDKCLSVAEPFNTEDITLVYSDDEKSNETAEQLNDDHLSISIVILSDDSDDERKLKSSPTKAPQYHSLLGCNQHPHLCENTTTGTPINTDVLPSPMTQNLNIPAVCKEVTDTTQLTEEDDYFQAEELAVNLNHIEDANISLSPFSTSNDTQNIILAFSADEDYNENWEPELKSIGSLLDHEIDRGKCPFPNIHSSNNISNGFKTPPRQHSILDFSDMELPNFNKHNEFVQNLTQNISDSIEISDDEVNYSTAQLKPLSPIKTFEKSIEIDSGDETDLPREDSSLLEKSMHSFLRRYERKISEDINIIENGNDENNEVNRSVNEFLFKSRFESTEKRPNFSSTKVQLKRYPSEPSFSRAASKTPKKLCFDQLKNDDDFDRLVFGEKINHNVVVLSPDSPLREIPKSPEPPFEENFAELDCPYNYFQPDEEYDIVLNQNTPKVNLNGTINLNETLYEGEKYIYKTRNVTPEPDYNNMDINMLHVELKKYGLKKISRAKAIKLLEYIYNETHPIIQDTDKESTIDDDHHKIASSQPVKQTTRSPIKLTELPATEIIGKWSGIDFSACDKNVNYFKTDNFTINLLNSNEMVYLPSKPRSAKLQYCPLPLHIAFFNLFRSNSKLRQAIFMYEPIEVEKMYFYFKSIGAKYEMNDLISFLDRRCITFRTDPKNKKSHTRAKN